MHQRSIFTALLPVLCVTGIVVLIVMWNKTPLQKGEKVQIEGPTTPPPALLR